MQHKLKQWMFALEAHSCHRSIYGILFHQDNDFLTSTLWCNKRTSSSESTSIHHSIMQLFITGYKHTCWAGTDNVRHCFLHIICTLHRIGSHGVCVSLLSKSFNLWWDRFHLVQFEEDSQYNLVDSVVAPLLPVHVSPIRNSQDRLNKEAQPLQIKYRPCIPIKIVFGIRRERLQGADEEAESFDCVFLTRWNVSWNAL